MTVNERSVASARKGVVTVYMGEYNKSRTLSDHVHQSSVIVVALIGEI